MATPNRTPRRTVRRPTSSNGPPVIVMILGLLGGIALLYYLFSSGANNKDADAMMAAAQRAFDDGASAAQVEIRLREAEADPDMTAEQRVLANKIREGLKVRDAEAIKNQSNMIGSKYLERKLRNYADEHLAGKPQTSRIRIFIKRTDYFLKRWPDHPEVDWVKRERDRFKGAIDLNAPLTFEDVAWEVEILTRAKPRDYKEALDAIDEFIATANDDDKKRAKILRSEVIVDRAEMHEENMVQAKRMFEYENDETKSISRLVWGVIGTGDETMSNEAASYLLKMPNCDAFLRGYRTTQPLVFERLAEHPMLRERIANL